MHCCFFNPLFIVSVPSIQQVDVASSICIRSSYEMESLLLVVVVLLVSGAIGGANTKWTCKKSKPWEQGFRPGFNSGSVHAQHGIQSGKMTLLDERRAEVANFYYDGRGPFTFWSARLRSKKSGTAFPLDQLGDYRDNLRLTATGTDRCGKAAKSNDTSVLITLPSGAVWQDVAWVGLYDWGYKYVFNFVWLNPTGEEADKKDKRFKVAPFKPSTKDVTFCDKALLPCPGTTNVQFSASAFCYRNCDSNKDFKRTEQSYSGAGDSAAFRCGLDLRDSKDIEGDLKKYRLYGCKGRSPKDPTDGDKCP